MLPLADKRPAAKTSLLSASHISRESIGRISEEQREPDWLRERRLNAARVYEALPLPRWERGIRGWWSTDISALSLEAIAPYVPSTSKQNAGAPAKGEHAGLLVQRDSTVVRASLDEGLAQKGVIFADLSVAAREYPDLVRTHLGGLVPATEDKMVAMHSALWSGGVLLYVPAGVEVVLPFQARFALTRPGAGMFVHTLVIAEAGSRVTYLEEYTSPAVAGQCLHSGVVELFAKDGAEVQFVTLDNWGETAYNFAVKRAAIERDARLRLVTGFLGSALTKATVETQLRGPGANLEMLGVFFGSGHQHLDLTSRTYHAAPHTNADVLFKGVVKDSARAALEGIIRVEKGAQQTTSYLSDHTLQLSKDAKSDSVPSLEIEANDVRVSHGATVGMIDEEQLYYLMTRGLQRAAAERTIVDGFFEPALARVPIAEVRRDLRASIARKMGA